MPEGNPVLPKAAFADGVTLEHPRDNGTTLSR